MVRDVRDGACRVICCYRCGEGGVKLGSLEPCEVHCVGMQWQGAAAPEGAYGGLFKTCGSLPEARVPLS